MTCIAWTFPSFLEENDLCIVVTKVLVFGTSTEDFSPQDDYHTWGVNVTHRRKKKKEKVTEITPEKS